MAWLAAAPGFQHPEDGIERMTEKTFQKNDIVTVTIDDIGSDGAGIGKVDGFTLFIKGALTGDTVSAKVMKVKRAMALPG